MRDKDKAEGLPKKSMRLVYFAVAIFSSMVVIFIALIASQFIQEEFDALSGACEKSNSVSDQEILRLAIKKIMMGYQRFSSRLNSGEVLLGYVNEDDFTSSNPECCKITNEPKGIIEKIFYPNLRKLVEVQYKIKFKDVNGHVGEYAVREWYIFSACGT